MKTKIWKKKLKPLLALILLLACGVIFCINYNLFDGERGVTDSDGDGIPDNWEIQYGLDPDNANDSNQDNDGDGYTNFQEYQEGTDPTLSSDYPVNDEEIETKVYVTVLSDSTPLYYAEVNLDVLPYDGYYNTYTLENGLAIFTDIEIGDYALFAKIDGVWKGGGKVTVEEGINYFTFLYYTNTDTWQIEVG